jgi:hypothetical protein
MNHSFQRFCLPILGLFLFFADFNVIAGTTFLSSDQPNGFPPVFCSVSSNGTIINMDATAYSSFGAPHGMAVDTNGNLFVAFTSDAIVEYTTNGSSLFVTNIGAPNLLGFDNLGRLYGNSNDCVVSITTNGASIYASGIAGLNGFCGRVNFFL